MGEVLAPFGEWRSPSGLGRRDDFFEFAERADEVGTLGIDEKIAGKGASTEEHGATHVRAVGEADEDFPLKSAGEDGSGFNENPLLGDAGGAADAGKPDDRRVALDVVIVVGGGGEADGFFVGGDLDVFGVDARAACTGVGFRVERGNAEIG